MEIKNAVALVTGSAQRVGRAVALALAQEGARLGLHYHASEDDARSVHQLVRQKGSDAVLLRGDLRNFADIERTVKQCHDHFGRLDILINNAAIYLKTPLAQTTEQQWDEIFAVNLKAPYFCVRSAATHMRRQASGKIINIADVAARNPWPNYIPYCVSKAGIIAMTRGLAKALAPDIQVNAIAPGTVLMGPNATQAYAEEIRAGTLLKRIGTPQDIANTALFLLAGSDYITGEVIAVDGGSSLL
jgi:NAD(P)-dependent dehydrogenase (short-subunit alcohol dehydrogenase family)